MGYQELDLETDPEKMAALIDRRSLLQQLRDYLKAKMGNTKSWNQETQEREQSPNTQESPFI